MAVNVPYKSGVADECQVSLRPQSDSNIFQVNPTIASGDFKIWNSGGSTWDNLATLPTVLNASGPTIRVQWSAGEAAYEPFAIWGHDAVGSEWQDIHIYARMAARDIDDLAYPVTSGRSLDVDASGYVVLAANGLDQISASDPGGVASTFAEMMVQLWRRFFKKTTLDADELITYADDGSTPVTTQVATDDNTTQTLEAAS